MPTCRSFFATTTRKPLPTPTCRQLCFAFFSLSSLLGSVGRNLFCSSGIRLGNWEGLGAVSQTMPWDPIGTRESGPTTCSQRRLGDQLGNKTTDQAHQRWCGEKVLSLGQKVSVQTVFVHCPCTLSFSSDEPPEAPPKATDAVARAVLRRSGTCRPVGGARFRWASGWR